MSLCRVRTAELPPLPPGQVPSRQPGSTGQGVDLYRLVVESLQSDALFVVNPDATVMSWNPGVGTVLGYSEAEFLGLRIDRLYPAEEAAAGKPSQEMEIAYQKGRWEGEAVRVRKDGSLFQALVAIAALRDAHNRHIGFSFTIRESTAQQISQGTCPNQGAVNWQQGNGECRSPFPSYYDGFILTDARGRVRFLNSAAEALTGWSMGNGCGRSIADVLALADETPQPTIAGLIAEVLREGRTVRPSNSWRLVRRDGQEFVAGIAVEPMTDEQNQVTGALLTLRDQGTASRCTHQNAVEIALLEKLVQGMPLHDWLEWLCSEFERLSPGSICSVLLLDENRLRHGAAPSLPATYCRAVDGVEIGPEVGSCGTAAFRNETVIVEDIEKDPLWKNYRDLARIHGLRSCWSVPFRSATGEVLGTFAIYHRIPLCPSADELERVRAWAHLASLAVERHHHLNALRESRDFFESLVGSLDGIVWRADPDDFRFTYVSKQAEKLVGYPVSAWYEPDFWVNHLHPDDREWAVNFCLNATQQGKDHHFEYRFRKADGSYIWIHNQVSVQTDAEGRPIRVTGLLVDVTEQKQIESRLRQTSKLEAIGQLAGGIAHDFNNLLTIITGYSEMALATLPSESPQREPITAVIQAAQRAAEMTGRLLAFSRQQPFNPKIVDVNQVIRNSEKMVWRLIGENIRLVTSYADSLDPIKADPSQLEQVILNLAVNARDAMPNGGTLTIRTLRRDLDENSRSQFPGCKAGNYTSLIVSDTGCGMTPEVQSRIFEPFFTTKEQGKGTGLGLATVYGIVRQFGGHIAVESTVNVGTTFTILFPAVATTVEVLKPENVECRRAGGKETLLLVEDDDNVRKLASQILKRHGYVVLEASNGLEALEIEKKYDGSIDLLVTDVVMPEMGGGLLAEALRSRRPEIKVLYMSGYPKDGLESHSRLQVPGDFLPKPFNGISLPQTVRAVLDEKSLGTRKLENDLSEI